MFMGITLLRFTIHHSLSLGHGGIELESLHLIIYQRSFKMNTDPIVITNSNKRKLSEEKTSNDTPEKRKRGKNTPSFHKVMIRMDENEVDMSVQFCTYILCIRINKNIDFTHKDFSIHFLPLISFHTYEIEITREEIGKRNTHIRQLVKKKCVSPTYYNGSVSNLAATSVIFDNITRSISPLDLTKDDREEEKEAKEETTKPKKKKKVTRSEAAKKKRSAHSFRRLAERNLALNEKTENKLYVEVVNTKGITTETDRHKVLQHLAVATSLGVDEVVRPDPPATGRCNLEKGRNMD